MRGNYHIYDKYILDAILENKFIDVNNVACLEHTARKKGVGKRLQAVVEKVDGGSEKVAEKATRKKADDCIQHFSSKSTDKGIQAESEKGRR